MTKPAVLRGRQPKQVLDESYNQIRMYLEMIHMDVNEHGLYSLTRNTTVTKHSFHHDERGNLAMHCGQFARKLFSGLSNKKKIVMIAKHVVQELSLYNGELQCILCNMYFKNLDDN